MTYQLRKSENVIPSNDDRSMDECMIPSMASNDLTTIRPSTLNQLSQTHPLEANEENWRKRDEKMNYTILRNTSGLHAPLRLEMEKKIANKFNWITKNNPHARMLRGEDDMILPEDFLRSEENSVTKLHQAHEDTFK
ncbi:hypothetical protein SNEBB_004186 [Seison nebaliae]|nr:hypothetical protein SNEBB_004186 [Seison nebaliae]